MLIQDRNNRQKFSRLRQSLQRDSERISSLIVPFFSDKPVIKGSVYELKRKCGKTGCKCNRGELHCTMVISSSEKGKIKLRVIPKGFIVEVKRKANRYRKLRRRRKKLIDTHMRMLQVMDEMEQMRREDLPSKKR